MQLETWFVVFTEASGAQTAYELDAHCPQEVIAQARKYCHPGGLAEGDSFHIAGMFDRQANSWGRVDE